jgi:hypothetical protein
MSDSNQIDLSQEVNFDYPEGFIEASQIFDFLPDDQARAGLLGAFINNMTLL